MKILVDDADHEGWRAEIGGLIDEWRTTAEIDLRDDDADLELELDADDREAMAP